MASLSLLIASKPDDLALQQWVGGSGLYFSSGDFCHKPIQKRHTYD
jgi:hypothetical protein